MGIHTWNHYVNYEIQCFENFNNLLNDFCIGCHTPDDMGGCHRCEVGRLLDLFIEYINDCHIDKPIKNQRIITPKELLGNGKKDLSNRKLVLAIKKAIKASHNPKEEPFYKWLRCKGYTKEYERLVKLANKQIEIYRTNWEKYYEKEEQ